MKRVQKLQRVIQPIYFKCLFREERKPFLPINYAGSQADLLNQTLSFWTAKVAKTNYIPSVLQPKRGFLSIPSNPSKTPHKACLFRLYRRVMIQLSASEANIIQGCLFSQTRENNSKLNITSKVYQVIFSPWINTQMEYNCKGHIGKFPLHKKNSVQKKKVTYKSLIQGHYFNALSCQQI